MSRPVPERLLAREREVAALLAEGLSNAQLAKRLYISTKTASVALLVWSALPA